MYGLVNQALEDFVRKGHGEAAWQQVRERAGVTVEMFVPMESYPDQLTGQLVAAATEVLGLDANRILEAFGEHWILYTAQEGYGQMLSMAGSNLEEFLFNLDNLHSHVGLTFSSLRPPSFQVERIEDGRALLLHYRSQRSGLAPMVVGLLKGLGRRFSQAIDICQTAHRGAGGHDHDTFRIDYVAAGTPPGP